MSFKDHFSGHASLYARYRPDYPPQLYEYLATLTSGHECALDCATGNGQAAVGLAKFFSQVIGTDASVPQLRNAQAHERVRYVANAAEQPAFRRHTFDLVTAAQAAHWFDQERFHAGVRCVLRPHGVLAVWTYGMASIEPQVDDLVRDFYSNVVGSYWPAERSLVESAYRTLPFPLHEIAAPAFELRLQWDLDALVGYLGTWSAVQRYTKALRIDPLPALRDKLAAHWKPATQLRSVIWPLHLRVGRPLK